MLKLVLAAIVYSCCQLAMADCDFIVINYTDYAVLFSAGFYGESAHSRSAKAATATVLRVNSSYSCNDANRIGIGRAYLKFPNDANGAGANYLARQDALNFMGKFTGDASGRQMTADNGSLVWLNSTGLAIDENEFQVKLNFVARPSSRSAGTQ